MGDAQQKLLEWLRSRPAWQQQAAAAIIAKGSMPEDGIAEIVAALKKEPGRSRGGPAGLFDEMSCPEGPQKTLRLVSISGVAGIDNLAPRQPLSFGNGNLTVVYGANGSGKSGYTRILKKVCGKPTARELRANVFGQAPAERGCTVAYEYGGVQKSVQWRVTHKPVAALGAVDIFDADSGRTYVTGETECSYTPPVIAVLEELARVCEQVKLRLQEERDQLRSALPSLPSEYATTSVGRRYTQLTGNEATGDVTELTTWPAEQQRLLETLEERLRSPDPAASARGKRTRAGQLRRLVANVKAAVDAVCPASAQILLERRREAQRKRSIAAEAATALARTAPLASIGSETWREMWEAARKYSTLEAYPGTAYPHVDDIARCVLCQQPLGPDAQVRLRHFEQYVTGELESAAQAAERALREALALIPPSPTDDHLNTSCEAAGLAADEWLPRVREAWQAVEAATFALHRADAVGFQKVGTPAA